MQDSPTIRGRLRLLILLAIYPLLVLWFHLVERLQPPRYFTDLPIDASIPYIPEFVIPYLAWFPLVAAVVAYFWITSPREYVRILWLMYTAMALSLIAFTLFPNGIHLRPDVLGDGFFDQLVSIIYAHDTPTNDAPSIHVVESFLMFVALAECARARAARWLVPTAGVMFTLVILSTMYIKQHAFLDVVVALVLGVILWFMFYRTTLMDPWVDATLRLLTPRSQRGSDDNRDSVPVEPGPGVEVLDSIAA